MGVNSSEFSENYQRELHLAIKACRLGREVLLQYFGRLREVEEKHLQGLVSEADRESEKTIFEFLKKHFPESELLGEESAYLGAQVAVGRGGAKGRWILDPLDGTSNYVHGFPVFCISLAFEVDGDIKVAVVDAPKLGEVYTATRGGGAFLNGRKLRVKSMQKFSSCFVATGFNNQDEVRLQEQLRIFDHLVREVHAVRRPGAAAYDLASVAAGVFHGFWERTLKPWDSAAGQLLVEEAGGVVRTYRGLMHDPYQTSLVAGSKEFVERFCKEVVPFLNEETK